MPSICFYFQVHQPHRIKKYSVFDIGNDHNYFEDANLKEKGNKAVMEKVAQKCYLPTNRILLDLIHKYPEFKISYSFSGTALEQMEKFAPAVLESFQRLVKTGNVEILSETYYHSLAFFYSDDEFIEQINLHRKKIKELFDYDPIIFRNTELSYNNELAGIIEKIGYKGILAEGWEHYLGDRSPNFLYQPKGTQNIKLLLKNYRLSDDIAFRFSNKQWVEHPLLVPKFCKWLNAVNGNGNTINLFMDYETFGEHQWKDSGIFNFLSALPQEILKHPDNNFKTPSELVSSYETVDVLDIHNTLTWADAERDLSAWTGNSMQKSSLKKIYELEEDVINSGDEKLKSDWRKLQTSDHFYYMCTKWFSDGDVHKYFSPYESPYEAFISYMNILNDFRLRIESN
ncbi:glycoside hydrolase family 57 protein [Patescibacteria group bacterium]|nr:glycoside hydrolase family 57 protein [Patescibacteria group bacterium]